MRVAVTGAKGFTGRYLLPELERCGHEVTALNADVTDADRLGGQIADQTPDAIIHLAARAFVDARDADAFYAVNQIGSFHLLDAVERHAPNAHLLLASTAQVYGAQAEGLIDEDQSLAPSNHYALSKTAMEMGARWWTDRLAITVLRPFNYTGVGQEKHFLVPKIIDHFHRRAATIELGNIDVARDFGDVRSVVAAYAGLVERRRNTLGSSEVLNICTGHVYTIRQLIARLEAMTGHQIEISINPQFVRANDVPVLGGRNDRLRSALPDWLPRTIDETLTWMLNAPND